MTLRENEWFIKVPWGRLCIVAWGSCLDPPVLVCHGTQDSIATFKPLIKLLPEKFYYVGMEFPGNGKSDPFPPGMQLNAFDLVYTVDAVVQHFRWETFAFMGHSLGAYVGKMYNVSSPDKVSKLIEIDPINFIGIMPDQFSHWYKFMVASFYENMDRYSIPKDKESKQTRDKAIETLKKIRNLPEDVAAATLDRWSEPTGNGFIRYTLDPRFKLIMTPPFSPEHIKKVFTNTTTPTLIITAKSSLEKGLYRNTKFLLDESAYKNKNCRCRIVEGTHDVHAISPENVAAYVAPFLLAGLDGLDAKAKL